nr:flippase [uncultured Sellimonas sp.]
MSSVKKNVIYNSFYQILIIVIPLITTPYVSRVLGKESIGLYSYYNAIALYFGMFILLGINNYGNRTIATEKVKGKEKLSKAFWSIYFMQILLGIVVIAIYIGFIVFFAENKKMGMVQTIYLLSVVLDINWFYFGMEEFKFTVTRNSIIKIFSTISIFLLVNDRQDIYVYSFIMVVSLCASQIVLFIFLHKYIYFVPVHLKDVLPHIKPNLILFIPVIAVSIYKIMDKIMLGFFTNMGEVGIYENSEKIIRVPTALITALGTVMLPKMTSLIALQKYNEAKRFIEVSLLYSVVVSSILCFGMVGVLPEFVPMFYGKGFEKCIQVIEIVILSSIFLAWGNVIRTQYLIPMKKDDIYIKSAIYGAVFNFIINLALIFKLLSVGTAIGTLIAEGFVCFYQCIKIRKELDFKKYFLICIPFVIIGGVMALILRNIQIFTNPLLSMFSKIVLGGVFYIVLGGVILLIYKKKHIVNIRIK